MTAEVDVQVENGIAVVTLNRPETMNALTTSGLILLTSRLRQITIDDEAAVVIVTGAGRAFCAGGDVASMAADAEFAELTLEGRAQTLRDLESWHHTRCGMTEDHLKGARAFVEKRKPQFKGR